MMSLRSTLKLAHPLLDQNDIEHAMIGGLAMACYGSTRATVDLDLLIREENKDKAKSIFLKNGFTLGSKPIFKYKDKEIKSSPQ